MNKRDTRKSRKGGFLDRGTIKKISETPEELAARMDQLYLDLARIHARIGRLLGIRQPTARERRIERLDIIREEFSKRRGSKK